MAGAHAGMEEFGGEIDATSVEDERKTWSGLEESGIWRSYAGGLDDVVSATRRVGMSAGRFERDRRRS